MNDNMEIDAQPSKQEGAEGGQAEIKANTEEQNASSRAAP